MHCTCLITPPATGYSVPFLRDSAGLGQALPILGHYKKILICLWKLLKKNYRLGTILNNLYIDLCHYTRVLNSSLYSPDRGN